MKLSPELSEQEIVNLVVAGDNLFHVFDSFLYPFYTHPRESFTEAWIYTEVPANKIGIRNGQPGDIDVLFVPMFNDKPQVQYLACAEVKIIRPTYENPGKDHRDSGRKQILGMVKYGIPIISLNHIILPYTNSKTFEGSYDPTDIYQLSEIGKHFSDIGSDRQMGRLQRIEFPDYVGYGACIVEQVANVSMVSLNSSRYCRHNTMYNLRLEERITNFIRDTPEPKRILPGRLISAADPYEFEEYNL